MRKSFPKTIYVTHESSSGEEWLTVRESPTTDADIPNTTPCAKYQLVEVGQVVVDRKFKGRRA